MPSFQALKSSVTLLGKDPSDVDCATWRSRAIDAEHTSPNFIPDCQPSPAIQRPFGSCRYGFHEAEIGLMQKKAEQYSVE